MNKILQNLGYGKLAAYLAAFLYSTTSASLLIIGLSINSFSVLIYTMIWACITLFVISFFYDSNDFKDTFLKIKRNDFLFLIIISIIRILKTLFFYYAIKNGPKLESNIINYTWPIFLYLLSGEIFKEKDNKSKLLSLLLISLSFLGTIFLFSSPGKIINFNQWNNIYSFAIFSSIFGALDSILYPKFKKIMAPKKRNFNISIHCHLIFLRHFIGLVFILLLAAVFFNSDINFFELEFNVKEFFYCAYLGVLLYGIGHWLFAYANTNVSLTELAIINYVSALLSVVWLVLLGEALSANMIIGGLIIICVNIILIFRKKMN